MHLGELRAATKLQVAIFRDFYVHTEHAVGSQAPKCLVRRGVSTAQARWSPRLLCFPSHASPPHVCFLPVPQPGTLTHRTRTTHTQADIPFLTPGQALPH